MARVIDITDKLDFDSNPRISIKGKEYEVNADAETVLMIMGLFDENGGMTPSQIVKAYELMFSVADRSSIKKLKLQFKDFQTVIMSAIHLIVGSGEDQGE
jgi:hypothetical protein